jgi:hypothetical protein
VIIILKRADLRVNGLAADQIHLHHTLLHPTDIDAAELIVFIESGKVYVLRATKWHMSKPMSGAELLKYIAEHAVEPVGQR